VAELVGALRADFELRGILSSQNASCLRRVETDFGMKLAATLTSEAIDTYINMRLARGSAPATINRVTQLLGQAYELAIEREHLSRAPHIRRLSEAGNTRKGFVDPADFARVLAALPDDLKDICAWLYATGQRKGEASSLTWAMLDGDILHIPGSITKNGKDRVLPLIGELVELIERRKAARYVNGALCEFIFHRGGHPVQECRKSWATATRKAGCPGLLLHDLRRSACRNLRKAGVPEQIAMQVSGHLTPSIFQRYSIVDTTDVAEALRKTQDYRQAVAKSKVVAMR